MRSGREPGAPRLGALDWSAGPIEVSVDGVAVEPTVTDGFVRLRRRWGRSSIRIAVPKALSAVDLPDRPGTVAFLDGPQVLAGLVGEERTLVGDPDRPATMLIPDQDRHHSWWITDTYRTVGIDHGFRFIGIDQVRDEAYTVHFPIRGADT